MKFTQRIVGWGLVAFGIASVFAGASPWFEGAHIEAVLIGGGFFVAGAWVLAGKELRGTIRMGLRAWRDIRKSRGGREFPLRGMGSSRHAARRSAGPAVLTDPLLPVRILKLAREQHGTLTVAQVAMELNVPLDQAQAGLDECVRAGNAIPDYDIPRAHALYRFPEFTEPDPRSLPG